MLNVEMLEKIARPGGRNGAYAVGEELPPTLEEIFARVVRDGWAPRSPAYGAELERLEASTIRGDCTAPLLLPGDTVYIDREMAPQPGDLVSFAMSQRLAELQNAAPPPGQLPTWKAGDRWIKLLVPYCGIDFLHERHGNSLTATLACCEDPDRDPVVLHPVRQVRRLGRLLFLPDAHCGEIGPNAATTVFLQTIANVTIALGGAYTSAASQSIGPYPWDTTIVVTATGTWEYDTGTNADSAILSLGIQRFSPSYINNRVLYRTPTGTFDAASTARTGSYAIEETFTLTKNTTGVYTLSGISTLAQSTSTYKVINSVMKTEVIAR